MVKKNKVLLLTIVSLIVVVLIGFFFFQRDSQANVDLACTQTFIEKETETGYCGDGTWGDWFDIDDNKEQRIYTGAIYVDEYSLIIDDTEIFNAHRVGRNLDGLSDDLISKNYSCDFSSIVYDPNTEWGKAWEARSGNYRSFFSEVQTVREGKNLKNKIGAVLNRTSVACQIVETREVPEGHECNPNIWSPAQDEVCVDTTFLQTNCQDQTREVEGTKICNEVCEPGEDEPWSPSTTGWCPNDIGVQASCGQVRIAQGTKDCTVIVEKCDDGFGNMIPGIDANNDGLCDVYEPAEINLEMECSLDGINWEDCEAHVWQLIHRNVPIKIKLVPIGDECSVATANPLFISNLLTSNITSNFGEISKIQDAFLVDMKITGEITENVFTKKVKANYCGKNGETEKDLQIKVIGLDYVEQ